MLVTVLGKTLELRYAFTISRGTKTKSESVFVALKHEGLVGWGEAAPNARYGETPASTMSALATMIDLLGPQPTNYVHELNRVFARVEGEYAAKAALDLALHDYLGKSLNAPLYRIWGLDPSRSVPTSMTIAMAEPEQMAARAREAGAFHFLKIKLGGADDRAMIRAIRNATDRPLRVDANEGWRDREAALREIEWLASQKVELVEQPMPAAQLEDVAWLKERSPLPLIADESFTTPRSLLDLADAYHGVNIKLQKCGGLMAARDAIAIARSLGLSIMLGCMVESSVGIAAAAHLAPLADYLDLDGHLLLGNDPFDGLSLRDGCVWPSDKPGLGVAPNIGIMQPDEGDEMDSRRED